ncbi:osmotically inducible protein OsmC [Dyadobacter koreensis]|uniref:Osmotically inducible protein OsmC n=1 Tax=Dyadobacter koreensis TaxID=408657 RepID=A0A1H6XPX1_9BACT|nr:OsmC family peroxiredoxin [Dyadobacter koreensis]SEJ31128.1 osmotically inducible protein OsmC [Dyadobacter koreensis]
MKRNATAVWNGSGKDGNGYLTTQSTALNQTQYSFNSRFADGVGTNPEELLAAAHAGCFTMKLSFVLDEAGFTANTLQTTAYINFENGSVTESHLVLKADVPGIPRETFEASVKEAELNCPISRVLTAKITVESFLE